MGAYSGVGAYLSKWVLGEGAYSGGGGGYSGVGAYSIIYGNNTNIYIKENIKILEIFSVYFQQIYFF